MRPHCPWRAAICETVATFVGSWEGQRKWEPRGSEEASPSLTGLRTAKLSSRSWASGRSSGVTPYADQNEASPPLGAANCETVGVFGGSWEGQRKWDPRGSEEAWPSLRGCDLRNCRHLSSFCLLSES